MKKKDIRKSLEDEETLKKEERRRRREEEKVRVKQEQKGNDQSDDRSRDKRVGGKAGKLDALFGAEALAMKIKQDKAVLLRGERDNKAEDK
jgi:hypothetical protein